MKRYIMIGAPVTSVRTPPLLTAELARLGVEAEIETRHVDPDDLDAFMDGFRADRSIDGLVVTMPHKRAIVAHLDVLTDDAVQTASVNTVKRHAAGRLAGAQFDGDGLVNALTDRDVPLTTSSILLAGLGGAGFAIARAIAAHGCRHLAIVDHDRGLTDRVLDHLAGFAQGPVSIARTHDSGFDILINATPLGMGAADASPFSEDLVARASHVADIVADPPETRLAAIATRLGIPLISGRDMVIGQIAPIAAWLLHPEP